MHSFLLKDSIISKETFLTGKVGPYMEVKERDCNKMVPVPQAQRIERKT